MSIPDIFSRRQRKARGEFPDVYQYKAIPQAMRVQIVHLMVDVGGELEGASGTTARILAATHDILVREYGRFTLLDKQRNPVDGTVDFLLATEDAEKVLDVVEVFFRIAQNTATKTLPGYPLQGGRALVPEAIDELNSRFREHGVGFAFESGEIIRVDSQLLHAEVVRPTLQLLDDPIYAGAEVEFLSAHEHYRHSRYPESINESLKAFESVMKVICAKRHWAYNQTDTAKKLIDVCIQNGLVPSALLSQFSSLRSALESGVPVVRNRMSGHGQGTQPVTITESLAAYVLHLAGANILFLAKAEKELP